MNDLATSLGAAEARPRRLGLWFRATRPMDMITSLLPCLAGGLVAINSGRARWWLLGVAMLAMLFVHAGTDASNEVEDFAHGVDAPDKLRGSRVFTTGLLSVQEGRRLYGVCFFLAFLLGVGICVVQGPALLVIGVIGILGGLLYTAGPRPYKYAGLGEPAIVLLMGPLITQGCYTAVTGDAFAADAFWLGLAPGVLIAAMLSANNLEDIEDDAAAGLRTLAVRLGFDRFRRLYVTTLLAVIPAQLALWLGGVFNAWILLPLLIVPLAIARAREATAATSSDDPVLEGLTPRTAVIHIAFCALLCVAVVLARTL